MLVCRQCGTPVPMSGRPCPSCGHRGAMDQRFYQGDPPAAADEATTPAAAWVSAWSPWLAGVVCLCAGPAAGGWFAAANLQRLSGERRDSLVAGGLLAAQWAVAALAAWLLRERPESFLLPPALLTLAVAAGLVGWQWGPVQHWRAAHPGRHTPEADAFGAFLTAIGVGVVGWLGLRWLGNQVGHGLYSQALVAMQESLAAGR